MMEVQLMVGLDQGQELVQTEIGLDALSVESMTILPGNVLLGEKIGRQNKYHRCLINNDQTLPQTPLLDTEDDVMTITPMETRDGLNL